MSLSTLDKKKLNVINNILRKDYGASFKFNENISPEKLKKIEAATQKELNNISLKENVQSNPVYSQCVLIKEAVNILRGRKEKEESIIFNESIDTQQESINQMAETIKKLKKKNPKKASLMEAKLQKLQDSLYSEVKSSEISMMLKEDAEKAEVIMASKNLLDTVQGFQGKISDVLNKDLDPFIERVRNEYDSETADTIREKMTTSLNSLMDAVTDTKDVFYNCTGILNGDEDSDDSVGDLGSDESMEDDDIEGMDLDDQDDDSSEENDDVDLDLDLDLDDDDDDSDVDSNEDDASQFKRRRE